MQCLSCCDFEGAV